MINYKKVLLIFFSFSLFFISCKNWDTPTYSLRVHIREGITGTPQSGVYEYEELEVVEYEYTYENDKEKKPPVFINDSSRMLSHKGAFAIYGPTDLYIGDVDPRGEWTMTYYNVDGDKIIGKIVYSGESIDKGTFTGKFGSGTWSVKDYQMILVFNEGLLLNVECTAKLSPRYLSGNWKNQDKKAGEWHCRRDKVPGS